MTNYAKFDPAVSKARCLRLRHRILEISQTVSALHMAGAYSCLEMVELIYFSLMRRDTNGSSPDTFVMSKGHGCLAQYVALEELGVLSKAQLDSYCKAEGILGCHPDYGNPGIEASTGSLGHGLSLAVGMAYADKVTGSDRRIFVMLSDGEFQEGSTWEAMLIAPSHNLGNLIAFLDLNDFQALGKTSEIHPNFYPIADKIQAFGWETVTVNGHNAREIHQAVTSRSGERPFLLVGQTIKGKGLSFMENIPLWHYRSPNKEEYAIAKSELREIDS